MIATRWLRYCDGCSLCERNRLHSAGQIQRTEYLFCVCGDQVVVAYSVIGLTKPMCARSFTAGLQDAKFLCNMPSTLFAFFFTSSACLDQLNVHVMCTPRYF